MQPANPGSGQDSEVGQDGVTVAPGDCIFSIAFAHGHFWRTVWDHPNNVDLRDRRGSPHVLRPGDRVFVPEIAPKQESGATEQRHRFKLKGVPIELAIEVFDNDEPRSGVPYTFDIEGRVETGTVPGDGIIRTRIYPSDRSGYLRVGEADDITEYRLSLGELDPAHTRAGAAHRLWNMGFLGNAQPSDDQLAGALRLFQGKQGLEPTGALDAATINKLAETHKS